MAVTRTDGSVGVLEAHPATPVIRRISKTLTDALQIRTHTQIIRFDMGQLQRRL